MMAGAKSFLPVVVAGAGLTVDTFGASLAYPGKKAFLAFVETQGPGDDARENEGASAEAGAATGPPSVIDDPPPHAIALSAKALGCYKKAAYGTVYALQAAVGAPYVSEMEQKLTAGLEPLVALALSTAVACIGVYLAFSLYCACAPPPKKAKVHKAGKALAALGSVGAVASFLTPLGATLGVYAQAFSGATVESTVAAFALSCALRTAATKGLDLTPIPSSTAVLVVPVLASLYLVVSVLLGLSGPAKKAKKAAATPKKTPQKKSSTVKSPPVSPRAAKPPKTPTAAPKTPKTPKTASKVQAIDYEETPRRSTRLRTPARP